MARAMHDEGEIICFGIQSSWTNRMIHNHICGIRSDEVYYAFVLKTIGVTRCQCSRFNSNAMQDKIYRRTKDSFISRSFDFLEMHVIEEDTIGRSDLKNSREPSGDRLTSLCVLPIRIF